MRKTFLPTFLATSVLVTCSLDVFASDASIAPPAALAPKAPDQGWSNSGRIGIFYSNVATSGSATSLDPSINSAHGSEAWLATIDDTLLWRGDHESFDQNVRLHYGRIDVQGEPWSDNGNEVHYDGVFRRQFDDGHTFVYGADGVDSVFRNDVNHHPLNPITAQVSAGVGQSYRELFFQGDPTQKDAGQDRLEARLGVRGQKRWCDLDVPSQDRIEVGPEGFLRYDRPVDKQLRWFIQYQIFSEFKDIHHISQLLTAGITAQLSRFVSVDTAFQAYRERQPKDVPQGTPGYDEWGMAENALVGLTVSY